MTWIELTEPASGNAVHIQVEHITRVRQPSDLSAKAKAQIDFTSGDFQGVREDVEQVMHLISQAKRTS